MRAEVIGIGAAAAVIDDEPDVEGFGLVGALPGLAEQARLIGGRQRRRFADVHVGRAEANDRADDGVDDVAGRARSAGAPAGRRARRARRHPRAAAARTASASRCAAASSLTSTSSSRAVMTTTSRSPGVCSAADHVRERVRIANRHQHVARTRLDLIERQLGGEQQVEARSRRRRSATGASRRTDAVNHTSARPCRSRRGDRRDVAGQQHGCRRSAAMTPPISTTPAASASAELQIASAS